MSEFAKQLDFASLKLDVNELDIEKLETVRKYCISRNA